MCVAMIKTIAELKGKEILFLATHVVEFFPAPLPNDLDGESVSSKFDLFMHLTCIRLQRDLLGGRQNHQR